MDKEKIAILKAQIDLQIEEIENIYAKIEKRKLIEGITALESISYQLHNLYSAFEDLFKIVARAFENHIDGISRYHIELLKRMTMHMEGVRPPLLSKESYILLDDLRGFRHLFRHAYSYELDERKVNIVLEDAARLKKIYKKDIKRFLNKISGENNGGFTLIELVMTIILTGILSVGLYEAVMFGINDYLTSENYLHSNNSMTYAMSVIRRNLVNAATPLSGAPPAPASGVYCPLSDSPSSGNPVIRAYLSGGSSTTSCDGTGQPACNEVAFYQYIDGTTNQQLVVFCVYNNILYEDVTNSGGLTTSYPVANNISGISF